MNSTNEFIHISKQPASADSIDAAVKAPAYHDVI